MVDSFVFGFVFVTVLLPLSSVNARSIVLNEQPSEHSFVANPNDLTASCSMARVSRDISLLL